MTDSLLLPDAVREEDVVTKPDQGVTHAGATPMLSTPALVGIVEGVCLRMLQEKLTQPQTSVGTHIDLYHLAACPAGSTLHVKASFLKNDRRRYSWQVQAFWKETKVGEGTHERAVIDPSRYQSKGGAAKAS